MNTRIPEWNPTHTGWYVCCPILLAEFDSEAPIVWPRWWWCAPLWALSDLIDVTRLMLQAVANPESELGFSYWGVRPIQGGQSNAS